MIRILLLLSLAAPAATALAQDAAPLPLVEDPALARLVAETLAARPELQASEARVRAERERVPQAGALPDPTLSFGIQNDGFDEIMVGKMETSFYSIGAAQTFPWPGKRGLREDAAALGVREAEASLSRARLGAEAEMRRAYLDLLLARDRLALLARLESLWEKSEGVARARYESGEGAQSDLLRAQLERTRLRQRRVTLQAEERARVAAVNRLRGEPASAPVETATGVTAISDPVLPTLEAAIAEAEARSPELAAARAAAARGEREATLARRERLPDITVSAGLMPRGGGFDPMWQAGVSLNLPIFAGRKQSRAVAEARSREEAARAEVEAAEQVVRLRVLERYEALGAALETLRLFRAGLLVQSRATAESALAQYRVGRVPFTAVLESVAGSVGDEDAFLAAATEAQRLLVAAAEVSLDPALPGGAALGGGMASGSMGGASAGSSPRAPARGGGPVGGTAPAAGGNSSPSMGGM